MTKHLDQYLEDIQESTALVRQYIADMAYSDFETDRKTQDAVIRRFEIIGEAVKNIPDNVRMAHMDVPWRKISGMRDVLAHEYGNVQLETVWDAATYHIDLLESAIAAIRTGPRDR